ncbi:hypothetical protein QCA50_008835 [Cerrena zonata]|uniref:Uncharacterized protein n=1 Tax=Cerrena zonata TaxID=2478898 RepID=A0AAW0G2Z4_9APHY
MWYYDVATQSLDKRPINNVYGTMNLYRDLRNTVDVDELEKKLAVLENAAATVIRQVYDCTTSTINLRREQVNYLRKFMFVMHYRSYPETYFDPTMNNEANAWVEELLKREHLSTPIEAWLHILRYYLDTDHRDILIHSEEAVEKVSNMIRSRGIYHIPPDLKHYEAIAYRSQGDYYYLGFWEAADEGEFVLTNNGQLTVSTVPAVPLNTFNEPAAVSVSQESSPLSSSYPPLSSVPSLDDIRQVEDLLPTRTPSPLSDSSTDSSSDFDHPADFPRPLTMSTNLAYVIASPKNVPILTSGKIQPESLTDWVHKCLQYFKTTRKLLASDHVATAATGLQDPLVQDWYMTDCDTFDLLTFPEFVICMKKRWLNTGWEAEIVTHIIRSQQFESNLFEDWVITLEKKNTLLKGTAFHFDDVRLRAQITANACDDVRDACNLDATRNILDFKDWKEALTRVDAQRVKDRARMDARVNSVIAAQAAHRSAGRSSSSHSQSHSTQPSSSSSTSSSTCNRPPKLTDEEKRLILKYHGCFKCRKLNVNHVSANCPDDFPSPVGYRPISEPTAPSVKPPYS